MKKLLLILIIAILPQISFSQNVIRSTQFYQSPQLYNPAFTGSEQYMDIKVGRKQNIGVYDFAPKTSYISVTSEIKRPDIKSSELHSLRISQPDYYNKMERKAGRKFKHGLGGILVSESQGPYIQDQAIVSYALHYHLSDKFNISLGIAPSIFRSYFNVDKIRFEKEGDENKLPYATNITKFQINGGILAYSERFYFGYSANPFYTRSISRNENLTANDQKITHTALTGYKIDLSGEIELLPGAIVSYLPDMPIYYNINTKVRYREKFWGGLGYQSSGSLSLLAGVLFNEKISFGYSYDYTIKGISNYISGSHELVIGIMLFKSEFTKPNLF